MLLMFHFGSKSLVLIFLNLLVKTFSFWPMINFWEVTAFYTNRYLTERMKSIGRCNTKRLIIAAVLTGTSNFQIG